MTLRRITQILLVVYILVMIYAIFGRPLGIAPAAIATPLVALTGFGFAFLHAGQREGWKQAIWLLALVFLVSLAFESVGVATGWVYGPYHYTDALGIKFLGLVPYLIPVAWFMMSYPSFVIADWLVPSGWNPSRAGKWQRILAIAAVGGLAMTAWDLVMDPIMVSGGFWVWDKGGVYFGIPLQNFWGWWLTVFTTFVLYQGLFRKGVKPADPLFDQMAIGSYAVTDLGNILAASLSNAGGLALVGVFAMLPWVVAGWLKMQKK